MNVCILGIIGDQLDEGMKNFGKNLHRALSAQGINTELFDISKIFTPSALSELRSFNPDICHLIPGPTLKGLTLLELLGRFSGAKTVVSATHPHLASHNKRILSQLQPDLMLVQSSNSEQLFENAGYETAWLPSGVDTEKFRPVSETRQRDIRRELGLPVDDRLFLHVGHLKRERNVLELDTLSQFGSVIVIGSPSTRQQSDVIDTLQSQNHHVYTSYIKEIDKYYQAADYYVFPTKGSEHSIEIPLSVLEAMACNKPILSQPFGGLPDLFDEGYGIVYFEQLDALTTDDFPDQSQTKTRELVKDYSWENTAKTAVQHYQRILQ